MKTKAQNALYAFIAMLLFGTAAVFGKYSATTASIPVQAALNRYTVTNPTATDGTAELISAAESRAISAVIEAERQYEQMDYEFFNGDAEAYQ